MKLTDALLTGFFAIAACVLAFSAGQVKGRGDVIAIRQASATTCTAVTIDAPGIRLYAVGDSARPIFTVGKP